MTLNCNAARFQATDQSIQSDQYHSRAPHRFMRVPVKCETKSKRNETKRNRSKRNETKPIETKPNFKTKSSHFMKMDIPYICTEHI
jgi:hypothetical protein